MSKKEKFSMGEANQIEKEYKEGLTYKQQMGFLTRWAECERFLANDQWPAVTEKTKNLPRPVVNIINRILKFKISSVMSENIRMTFTADDTDELEEGQISGAERFTRYSDTLWEKIKQNQLNEEVLEDCANLGIGIWHYYWDNSKQGGNRTKYIGEICGEAIDPVNFFPANPQSTNVQKQPYIIITHRDVLANVKEEAKANGVSDEIIEMITPDNETEDQAYAMAKQEIQGSDKLTVLTKYWKENGTIHFMKVSGGIVIKPKTDTELKRYPLATMNWERRKRSIYGMGDTEAIIPNQKQYNLLMAMQILATCLTSFPKLLVDKTVVKQKITNTPGEIVYINGQAGSLSNSIQYLNPTAPAGNVQGLADSIMQATKDVMGANESALGEQQSAQMNATALMMLQKASGVPLESIKRRFYQANEDIGLIWLDFWTTKYNMERTVTLKNDDDEPYQDSFTGTDYGDIDMNLKIDIGASSAYSETIMMASLDKMFDGQHIDAIEYLTLAPKNVIPFKDRLIKILQDKAAEQQMMQEQMMAQQMGADPNVPPMEQGAMPPEGMQPPMEEMPPQDMQQPPPM